jgi:hypothetical protein
MGDKWQIFLLQDKEEKPTAVLLPSDAREGVLSPVTEVWLFLLFGVASIISSMQSAGVPVFQFLTNPFYTEVSQQVGWSCSQAAGWAARETAVCCVCATHHLTDEKSACRRL